METEEEKAIRVKKEEELMLKQETKEELMLRLGLTGTGVEHSFEHFTRNNAKGVIEIETVDTVYENGVFLAKKLPHNRVLDPASKDYDDKLAAVTEGVMGTLAIQQNKMIADKDAELVEVKAERDALKIRK